MGIPKYQWLNDDQHGVARTTANATVFPNGCGLGATWSPGTLYDVGRIVGSEARGLHNGFLAADPSGREMNCNGCGLTMYAPNLNLVRDPRWGRAQEVYTEDPHLMSRLVVGFVTGSQNNSAAPADDKAGSGQAGGTTPNTTPPNSNAYLMAGACCKHFAAYNVEGGAGTPDRYSFNAQLNGRDMWETYMPAFEACAVEAKAMYDSCYIPMVV